MAVAKEFLFKTDSQLVAGFGKAIGHAARVEIVSVLLSRRVISYETIKEMIPLDRSTVNDHLRILQRSRLLLYDALPDGSAGYRLDGEQYNAYRHAIGRVFNRQGRLRQLPDSHEDVG